MDKCQEIAPSSLRKYIVIIAMCYCTILFNSFINWLHSSVWTGGLFFETGAKKVGGRRVRHMLNYERPPGASLTRDERDQLLLEELRVPFYLYIMLGISQRDSLQGLNTQLFYLTLLFNHDGLFQAAMRVLSGLGLNMLKSSYEEQFDDHSGDAVWAFR